MKVRKSAQSALSHGFHVFAYSYRTVLDDVIRLLHDDNKDMQHHFKVCNTDHYTTLQIFIVA